MKHKGIISKITREIIFELKQFMESDGEDTMVIDLPNSDDYFTKKIYGVVSDFIIELYLFKTNDNNYMIIGDAPGDISDDNIRIGIYVNPQNYKRNLTQIYFNLIYTIRHEFEHLCQVISGDTRNIYKSKKKYRGDSLSTLMKECELEPQTLGYHLQSKKENKPFDEIVQNHLLKLENNQQITFKNETRKQILINEIKYCAKLLNLKLN